MTTSSVAYYSAIRHVVAAPGASGSLTLTIPFPYLQQTHIYVYVDNVMQLYGPGISGRWEFDGPNQVKLNRDVPSGSVVWVRRFTRKDARMAEFFNGSVLTEEDMNIITKQLLYLIQELIDYMDGQRIGQPPPGGPGSDLGDGPGNSDTPGLINQIIAEILDTQIFRDLIELIELVDINAESVLSNSIEIHTRWGEDRRYGGLIRQLDTGLDSVDARITEERFERITADEAAAGQLLAFQARFNDAEADLIEFRQALTNNEEALTEYITVAESRFLGAEARIGTVETTYASKDYAEAYTQQQLDTRFAPANFNASLNASSVITGIRTTSNAAGSSVNSIASYLVGSGVTANPDGSINWPSTYGNATGGLARAVGIIQTTISGHTTQLNVELQMRQAMAASFSPGNTNNPAALVAAMENKWQVYADSQSATASSLQTLQVNRQPIFFRPSPPNPFTSEFDGQPFRTVGFPEGALWYRQSGRSIKPYRWLRNSSPPFAVVAADDTYGPYSNPGTGAVGLWVIARDTDLENAVGARIDNYHLTEVFRDRARALSEETLTTVFNVDGINVVNAVARQMVSMVDTRPGPNGEPRGFVYSSYNVRMNQYINGQPVVAGFGLGLEQDVLNPNRGSVSDFIVLANRFSVIAPVNPSNFDPLTGALNTSTVTVPFVIDTANNRVMVNGELLARSLTATAANVGRLTVTELHPTTFAPVNPLGRRLVLPSNTAASGGNMGLEGRRYLIWSGAGQMSDNNATFWLDTDGNAFFGGRVNADGISGEFQRIGTVFWSSSGVLATSWTELTQFTLMAPRRLGDMHTPVITLSMFVQHLGGSNGVMGYRVERLGNLGWELVDGGDLNQSGGTGTNHAITVIDTPTTGQRTYRFTIGPGTGSPNNPQSMRVQSVKGFIMGVR